MSGRIERARAIRAAARRKKSGHPYQDQTYYEMGLYNTVAMAMLLLFAGAFMATAYIMISRGGCLRGEVRVTGVDVAVFKEKADVGSATATAATATPVTLAPVSVSATEVSVASNGANLSPVKECDVDQMEAMKKNLSPTSCYADPFLQQCSFTVATVKSGSQDDTAYYRQPVATMMLSGPFTAVLIGLVDQDDTPIDLLAIGSHNPEKYKVTSWREATGGSVRPTPGAIMYAPTHQPARVFVVEGDASRVTKLNEWKTRTGLTDDELKAASARISKIPAANNEITLTTWIATMIPAGDIHYLKISNPGSRDYEILSSGKGTLERVWYIDFFLDWKGDWAMGDFKELLTATLSTFACYWHGAEGNLWRISGCWQSHYSFKSWAKVVCVNTNIEAARPVYDKMEEAFARTLAKGLSF